MTDYICGQMTKTDMLYKNQIQIKTSLSVVILIVGIATSWILLKENVYYGIFSSIIMLSLVVIVNLVANIRLESDRCGAPSDGAVRHASDHDATWEREKIFNRDFSRIFRKESMEAEVIENGKLEKILAYTRKSFIALQFTEEEVLYVCHQVEHFIRYRETDDKALVTIARKGNVTQAALKNYSWNIAYQYGISRAETTKFVMTVFNAWFANAEPHSVYNTLKTSTGTHAIEIDTHII